MKINGVFYYPGATLLSIVRHRLSEFIRCHIRYIRQCIYYKKERSKTKLLKNSKVGKKIFVFANGPSVSNIDPHKVKSYGYDVFGINSAINSEFLRTVNPNYYLLSDPGYFDISNKNYSIYNLLKKNQDVTLFFPFERINGASNHNIYGFCDFEYSLSRNIQDILKPYSYLSASAYKTLAITLYMGYSEIYIAGFDNDYFLTLETDVKNSTRYLNKHFYDNGKYDNVENYYPSIGYMFYNDHRLFNDLEKFKKDSGDRIINIDPRSLNPHFTKEHQLDIYVSK